MNIIRREFSTCTANFINIKRFEIKKIARPKYYLKYPVSLIMSNGCSLTVRHHEPRKIIKFPENSKIMTDKLFQQQERKKKAMAKHPPVNESDYTFTHVEYCHLWKSTVITNDMKRRFIYGSNA